MNRILKVLLPNKLLTALSMLWALLTLAAPVPALATFITYTGGSTVEAQWRIDAGGAIPLEDFESYAVGTQFSSLQLLGIGFAELAGGGYPVIYNHSSEPTVTPYGSLQLGNFPNGINTINQYDDMVLFTLPGWQITAVGFYNGDGQSATLVATAYDSANNALGSVGALKGNFAGMISSTPIASVVFDGNTGDGWNHLDGLQTNAITTPVAAVPIPATFWLFSSGLALLMLRRRTFV